MQEIMNKVHFLPSSVKDTDEAIAWCAVHLTAPPPPPPPPPPTDRPTRFFPHRCNHQDVPIC